MPTALIAASSSALSHLPYQSWSPGKVATIDSQVIRSLPDGISIASVVLTPGSSGITLSGTVIPLGSSALIIGTRDEVPGQLVSDVAGLIVPTQTNNILVGSSTYPLPTATEFEPNALSSLATLSIGGQAAQYAPGPTGRVLIGDQTIAQGSQATISGTVISVGKSDFNVDHRTYALPTSTEAVALIEGGLLTVTSSDLMVGDSEHAVPMAPAVVPLEVPVPVSVGGQAVHKASQGGLIVGGSTLMPGAPGVIISGAMISLNSASDLILGSKTIPLEIPAKGSDGLVIGRSGSEDSFPTSSQDLRIGPVSRNGTMTVRQDAEGKASDLRNVFCWKLTVPHILTIVLLSHT